MADVVLRLKKHAVGWLMCGCFVVLLVSNHTYILFCVLNHKTRGSFCGAVDAADEHGAEKRSAMCVGG